MQKLFTLDGGAVAIPEGMCADICCPPPVRCRPLQIRMPAALKKSFDIKEIMCGTHRLQWLEDGADDDGTSVIRLCCDDLEPSKMITDVGSYFTVRVCCEDLPTIFRAEVWGIDIEAEIASEAADAFRRYVKHNPGIEGCGDDVREAFHAGYSRARGGKS